MAFYHSLRFQTSAIILASFLVSHVAGLLFYTLDRRGALEMTEAIDRFFAPRLAKQGPAPVSP